MNILYHFRKELEDINMEINSSNHKITEEDLRKINNWSGLLKRCTPQTNTYHSVAISEEDVFTFSILLADNDIYDTYNTDDGDFECYSNKALSNIAHRAIGKAGQIYFYPHVNDTTNGVQRVSCRIYDTTIKTDHDKLTAYDMPYVSVEAKVYIVKSEDNKDLISELKKQLIPKASISCCITKRICSICGEEYNPCDHHEHIKGDRYNNKWCFHYIEGVNDIYDWHFSINARSYLTNNIVKVKRIKTPIQQLSDKISELSRKVENLQDSISCIIMDAMGIRPEDYKGYLEYKYPQSSYQKGEEKDD